MKGRKHGGMMAIAFAMIVLVLFLPVLFAKMQDNKMKNKIHIESVSPSRDALLTALTLEERIGLFCSSEANPVALYGWQDMSVDSESESQKKVTVEYSYIIKDTEEIEMLEQELEKMVMDGVLPEIALLNIKNGYTSGTRFYLYSEEKDQGAVFLSFESYSKKNANARYIMDEESGKIIGVYLYKEDLKEYVGSLAEYGQKFLSYLGWESELVIERNTEQYFRIKENGFSYYIYLTDEEMGFQPNE